MRLAMMALVGLTACGGEPEMIVTCYPSATGCDYEACCEAPEGETDPGLIQCWYEMPDGTRYECDGQDCYGAAEDLIAAECNTPTTYGYRQAVGAARQLMR